MPRTLTENLQNHEPCTGTLASHHKNMKIERIISFIAFITVIVVTVLSVLNVNMSKRGECLSRLGIRELSIKNS